MKRIIWKSEYYATVETLQVSPTDSGYAIHSVIERNAGGQPQPREKATFAISIDKQWRVRHFEIESMLNGRQFSILCESSGDGSWTRDGKPAPEFDGCIDIDILPTPFTNTLPMRRLDFSAAAAHEIKVLYVDLLGAKTYAASQRYTKISETRFMFETIPADFTALLTVDGDRFIVGYPGLFSRQ